MTTMYKLCWAMWIGGTILIVASWADVVSPTVGWIGFGAALVGTLLSFLAQQRPQQSRFESPGTGPKDQTSVAEAGTPPARPRD
jgi:hypothetical protein